MNNEDVNELLKNLLLNSKQTIASQICGATTNLQLAQEDDLCFYRIFDTQESLENFHKRYKASKCRNIITTADVNIEGANIWVVDHKSFLDAQKMMANRVYPNSKKLKVVGVTGTNGKTTCSYLAMQIAALSGLRSLSIGTIGIRSPKEIIEKDLLSTTPSYLELSKIIHKYQSDYDVIFLEVSSHALVQKRLLDIELECGAWTSFSQDHLDYHKTIQEYFDAKALLIDNLKDKSLVVSIYEKDLINKLNDKKINCDIVSPEYFDELSIGFKARYNQSNLFIAKKLVEKLINKEVERDILAKLDLPDGRFEPIPFGQNLALVDYAHTPDALENICKTIREDFSEYSLTVVFGCGGDRDRTKRSLMGEAVSKFANKVIITSDNPRTENPMTIISDAASGVSIDYTVEENRESAIRLAMTNIAQKTVVLVAGKGHEDYQDVMGEKKHFSDREVILKVTKEI